MEFQNEPFNLYLLIFSFIIQLITSFTAYDLYLRNVFFKIHFHWMRLFSVAVVLGLGIWCMHFIGTLSYKPLNLMTLDPIFVVGSLLLSIGGCYLALGFLRIKDSKLSIMLSSLIMMLCVVSMHFVGVHSLHKDALLDIRYSVVIVAILLLFFSFYLVFRWVVQLNSSKEITLKVKLKCGLLTAIGVSVFHYIEMFTLGISSIQPNVNNSTTIQFSLDMTLLAISIGFATTLIILMVLIASFIEGKFSAQTKHLKTNEQYYQALFDYNPDLVLTFDVEGYFLSTNKVVEEFGFTREELLNTSFLPLIVPELQDTTLEEFQKARNGIATTYETSIFNKFGDRMELNITNIPIIIDGEVTGIYGIIKNITNYKHIQNAIKEAELKYRTLVEESLTGIYIIQDNRYVYVNPQFLHLSGYAYDEVIGAKVSQFIHPEDVPLVQANIQKRITGGVKGIRYQYRAIKKDQSIIYLEVYGTRIIYQNKPAIIGSFIDITEQKIAEQKIQHIAYHDFLTELPNRYQFNLNFNKALVDQNMKNAAILFVDLDRFKVINDTFGHDIGDLLLIEVAKRLELCIHPGDSLARIGGDEFILFLPNIEYDEVSNTAQKILSSLNKVIQLNDYEMYITPSIGISLYPQDGEDSEILVKKADLALQQVKRTGKNNFQFYRNHLMEYTNDRFELENELRKAIENEEFVLYYQPKFDIQFGDVIGMEALIRWKHHDKGLISPSKFIPLAEETGMIVQIGEWVLRTACSQMKALQDNGYPPMIISVNLSLRQFFQKDLIEMVKQVLNETELSPEFLELEITESMMIDTHHALGIVTELRNLGVLISLDDFGTGYSSLHYLKKFPINKIKIDQSFIRDSLTDSNDEKIVKTIIALAHNLNMEVIAEGVESKEQLRFLQQNLCDSAQGYLFSEPIPIHEFMVKFNEFIQNVNRLGVPQEIRNQKWMEEALKIVRQELQDTIRKQQGMIYKVKKIDGDFIYTLCDGELVYRLGFVPEQVIGSDVNNFLTGDNAAELYVYYERAWSGEEDLSFERERNGIYYITSLRPIRRGGQVIEIIGSCVDITARKKAEEALRESEAKYRLIADNMSDLVGVLDVNGILQYASPSHETILGYSPQDIEGNTISHLLHPEDEAYIHQKFMDSILLKKSAQAEFRHKHADGHWVYMEAKATPVYWEDGQLRNIVIVARDITERKNTEDHIRKSDRLTVVGELAAGIAHEIRNPLTSIKGFVQLLKNGMSKPDYFDIMLSEFKQIENIIDEFIVLAKPQDKSKEKLELIKILLQVIKFMEAKTVLYKFQFKNELDHEVIHVFGIETQLKQVFINLLKNAMESMPAGGEIVIQVVKFNSDNISIIIKDHGYGISPGRMKKLGEPFYSTKEKGTGLGLMVSNKIIEEHKGTIHIDSEVGKGTTVEVSFPNISS